ncbi:MAG: hypothetical protein K2F99_08770, partial [Muribaculaceae bacterium]|nr:hypothetical protein [Muribaculaceae bacterium]
MKYIFIGSTSLIKPTPYEGVPGLHRIVVSDETATDLGKADLVLSPYQAQAYASSQSGKRFGNS